MFVCVCVCVCFVVIMSGHKECVHVRVPTVRGVCEAAAAGGAALHPEESQVYLPTRGGLRAGQNLLSKQTFRWGKVVWG